MRIWDYRLLPYLPDRQFRGQLRELVLIMRQWRDKGKTNHLLINRVMEYSKNTLTEYFLVYFDCYKRRYNKFIKQKTLKEFLAFNNYKNLVKMYSDSSGIEKGIEIEMPIPSGYGLFDDWHNKEYLRVCMANLYEKHHFGIGKSWITDEEWQILLDGYKKITNEDYKI